MTELDDLTQTIFKLEEELEECSGIIRRDIIPEYNKLLDDLRSMVLDLSAIKADMKHADDLSMIASRMVGLGEREKDLEPYKTKMVGLMEAQKIYLVSLVGSIGVVKTKHGLGMERADLDEDGKAKLQKRAQRIADLEGDIEAEQRTLGSLSFAVFREHKRFAHGMSSAGKKLCTLIYKQLTTIDSASAQMDLQIGLDLTLMETPQSLEMRKTILERLGSDLHVYEVYSTRHYTLTYLLDCMRMTFPKVSQHIPTTFTLWPKEKLGKYERKYFKFRKMYREDLKSASMQEARLGDHESFRDEKVHASYLFKESHPDEEHCRSERFVKPADPMIVLFNCLDPDIVAATDHASSLLVNPDVCVHLFEPYHEGIYEMECEGKIIHVIDSPLPVLWHCPFLVDLNAAQTDRSDTGRHPELIMNMKGIRLLRRIIFSQFTTAIEHGYRALVIGQVGCAQCKIHLKQIAALYAEAIELYAGRSVDIVTFTEFPLYNLVNEIINK